MILQFGDLYSLPNIRQISTKFPNPRGVLKVYYQKIAIKIKKKKNARKIFQSDNLLLDRVHATINLEDY